MRVTSYAPGNGGARRLCDWQSTGVCNWNTSALTQEGNYKLLLEVRRAGQTLVDAQQTLRYAVGKACPSVNVTVSPTVPEPDAPITFTAVPTCDPGVTPEYRFEVQPAASTAYLSLGDWQTSSSVGWDSSGFPAGTAKVKVTLRQRGYKLTESDAIVPFVMGSTLCKATSIVVGKQGPDFSLTGASTCTGGGVPEYRFVDVAPDGSQTVLDDWSASNTSVWPTTGLTGTHFVRVEVRAQGSSQTASRVQVSKHLNGSCTTGSIPAPAPVYPGHTTTFTVNTDCPNPEVQYLLRPAVGGTWKRLCSYTTAGCDWNVPADVALGSYEVRAYVRAAGTTIIPQEILLSRTFQVVEEPVVVPPDPLGPVTDFASGDEHNCAVRSGKVFCWGEDSNSQCGDGVIDAAAYYSPIAVVGLSGPVESLSASWVNSCAMLAAGGAQCWGSDGYGQLGDQPTEPDAERASAVDVLGLWAAPTQLSPGGLRTCARLATGEAACWGLSYAGEVVNGTPQAASGQQLVPFAIASLGTNVASVQTGYSHMCVLTTAGNVKCWGANSVGTLGNGSYVDSGVPVDVAGISNVSQVAVSIFNTCAVLSTGAVYCWGANDYGQLGIDPSVLTKRATAGVVPGLESGVVQVSLGRFHGCALFDNGEVKCWGLIASNGLPSPDQPRPLGPAVTGFSGAVVKLRSGFYHACALLDSGELECFGDCNAGQCGDPALATEVPVPPTRPVWPE